MNEKYFEQIGTTSNNIKMPGHGWLDMKNITEAKAKQLWDEKFPYLALTKKGAEHYFKETKPTGLIQLIVTANSVESVKALLSLSSVKTVKEAALIRVKELRG